MLRNVLATTMLVMLMSSMSGCATQQWVNIPAQPGDMARHDPNLGRVREVSAAALQAVMRQHPPDGRPRVILPDGATSVTYASVLGQMEIDAVGELEDDAEFGPTYEVAQVRIRPAEAEVDIVAPASGGTEQVMTVYLEHRPFSGWSVRRLRTWQGTRDAILRANRM